MKKYFNFALFSAIALLGSYSFTACTSDDDAVADNPGYNSESNVVPVNFVMNVSTGNGSRMSAGATQATTDQPFRGIDHARILTDKQTDDGKHIAAAKDMDRLYDLSQILAANTISTENSRRVLEMSLPLNTNTIMFYGKAIEGSATSAQAALGLTAYDLYGRLAESDGYHVEEDLSNVAFEVEKRLTAENKAKFTKIQQLLAGMLTCIMNTNLEGDHHTAIVATNTPGTGIPAYGFDIATDEYNEFTWGDYANANGTSPAIGTNIPLTPLEEKLAAVYKEMVYIQKDAGELRCGSGEALERTLQDLWTVVNSVRCASTTSKADAIAKFLATRINNRLNLYLQGSIPTDGGPVTTAHLKDASDVISALASDSSWPASAGTKPSDFSSINTVQLSKFPKNFNLPAGSTHLQWDNTNKYFSYVQNYNSNAVGGSTFTVDSYYYSPELLYFGNSPIRVSNDSYKTNDYPQTTAAWDTDATWTANGKTWVKNKHVLSTTRSVAMINDINYGTALLETHVGYKATTLKDNNHAIQYSKNTEVDEPDKEIEVNSNSFQLVGLLVGGQSKKVGWNYLPVANAEQGYVYDFAIANSQIPASGVSDANYTLVFDNYTTAANQDKVYVALELKNNTGEDFFGLHNMIRDGGTFYLIGELDPTQTGLTAPTWPTYHPLPPYNADGTSIQTTRVFMQDYKTTATFKLDTNSLKYAYLTVPDLRSSSLTLGLSVDITWSTGLNFEEIILGGN